MIQHYFAMAELMDEAAKILAQIPDRMATALKIRLPMVDELGGFAIMLRDGAVDPTRKNEIVAYQNPYKLYELYTEDQLDPMFRPMMIPLYRGPFLPSEDEREEFEKWVETEGLSTSEASVAYRAWVAGRKLLMENVKYPT